MNYVLSLLLHNGTKNLFVFLRNFVNISRLSQVIEIEDFQQAIG